MKKVINIILLLVLVGIGVWLYMSNRNSTIVFSVTNAADFARNGELIEVPFETLGVNTSEPFVLYDSTGREVAYQLTDKSMLFQVSVEAQGVARYLLRKGNPAAPMYKVFARFVPERKDDFAWENDIAAYRMYGPALADENPSNGVDLWLKKTDDLIVDTFYYREHELGLPYHIDYGKGLDCYKVGHTVGCGGVALLKDDSLYVGNHYDQWEILEAGSLRTIFELRYDSVLVDTTVLQEVLRVTVSAGSVLNKAEVTYYGAGESELNVAAGIFLHNDSLGVMKSGMPDGKWIAYAENARSDAGLDMGRNYAAVVMPESEAAVVKDGSLLLYQPCMADTPTTYYFGGGWSQWRFPTDEDWFDAVSHAAMALKNPLQIAIVK